MQKPVCLAVAGISIVVTAVSLGVALTRYLGLLAYSPKGTAQAAATPGVRNVPAAPAEEWNNLFAPGDGMKLASRLPAVNANTASQASRTSFVLVGTIVSSTRSASRGILWANGMKEPKAFRETEEVEPGAFLASVERDKVWITRGKEREKLEILPVGSRVRPTGTAAPAVASQGVSATPSPGFTPVIPPRPGTAVSPGLSPDRTQTVGAPPPPIASSGASSGEEEEESPGRPEGRRRSRGTRR
jgi:hypothetical protein